MNINTNKNEKILNLAREVFDIEAEGLNQIRNSLDGEFVKLVDECVRTLDFGGKIVVTGIGKSGHIARKIASTLASTGSASVFMHPVEAMHGDLGILQKNDILVALSYSGESDELVALLPSAKILEIKVVSVTGNPESKLARWCDITISAQVQREACPFNLAPTTSATALLVIGDALAMTLLKIRGFTKEDYGRLHPGGAIGRAVTLRTCDIMRTGDRLVMVAPDTLVKDTLVKMTRSRTGSAAVVDAQNRVVGIFTDGDFRRHVESDLNVLNRTVSEVMTHNPSSVMGDSFAVEVIKIIQKKHIDDIIVTDAEGRVIGLVDIQDLPGLKLL